LSVNGSGFQTRTLTIDTDRGVLLHDWPKRVLIDDDFADLGEFVEISPDKIRMSFQFRNAWAAYRLESYDRGVGIGIWAFVNGDWQPPV